MKRRILILSAEMFASLVMLLVVKKRRLTKKDVLQARTPSKLMVLVELSRVMFVIILRSEVGN